SLRVEVPAGAAALCPDALRELALDRVVEAALRRRQDIGGDCAATVELVEETDDVLRLLLDHEHDGVVAEAGVRAQHEEEVRKTRRVDTEVGLDTVFVEDLAETLPLAAGDVEVLQSIDDVEIGRAACSESGGGVGGGAKGR